MKIYSYYLNTYRAVYCLICILIVALFSGCYNYSFTGGSVPEHLNTLYIAPVIDNTGFGNPQYREELTLLLTNKFQSDGSFELTETRGDARLKVTMTSISEAPVSVSTGGQRQLENERKVTVTASVEYYDNVERKEIWNKSFSNYDQYEVSNIQTGRSDAIRSALDQLSDDILLAVVSGW